jgi:CBS domain-containing protein
MKQDPPSPGAEFWMAIVGPLTSAAISSVMFLILALAQTQGWPVAVSGVLAYLAWLNLVLAVFNLAPAFPLDGGRILRSALWRWKKDLRWATSVAANVGSGLAVIMMALGIVSFFMGNFVGGLWWLMIGFFLRMAAQGSYQQMLARNMFHGVKVRDIMVKDPVAVSRSISLEEFVHEYVYQNHYQIYPVASFGKFSGCVTVQAVGRVPRDEWPYSTVGSVAEPCGPNTTIDPEASAEEALTVMNRTGNSRLLVVEGDKLAGIVSLEDMLKLLSTKK